MQWSHTWQNHPAARFILDALSTGGRAAFYAGNIQRGVQIGAVAGVRGKILGAVGGLAVSVGTELVIECGIERGIDAVVARGMDEAQVRILAEVTGNYLQIFGSVRTGSGRVKRVKFNQQTLQSLYQSFLPQYAAAGPYNNLPLLPPPPATNPRPTPGGARTSAFAGRTPKSGGNAPAQSGRIQEVAPSKSLNQLKQEIKAGKAPRGIVRIDSQVKTPTGTIMEKTHVHFDNGSALNIDGTWKHGGAPLSSAQQKWLTKNGWRLPDA